MKHSLSKVSNWVLLGVLALGGCALLNACEEKTETKGLSDAKASNIVFSDCHNHNSDAKGYNNPDSVSISYNNGTISVTHYNLIVNCGFQKVFVNVDVDGNTIRIGEWGYPENADCICEVDNSFEINNIPRGTYNIVFENWASGTYSQTYTF